MAFAFSALYMTIRSRRILAGAFISFFIIAAPALILHTAGLRWNFKKWSWQKTGSVYIEVEPKDVNILINGKEIDQKIPAIINALSPDAYNIKIEKNDYISWERNIEILPEKTSIIKDIILLPKNIKRQKEAAYLSSDAPVVKSKEGSFVYAENIWKYELAKIKPKSDYVLIKDPTDDSKTLSSIEHFVNLSKIPKEAAEIMETDGASFAVFKDEQNGLIVGSITDNIFSKIDYLKEAGDLFFNESDLTLTVSDGLELTQYKLGERPIKKNLIIRSSSNIDRILPIRNSLYTIILQGGQIKIAEYDPYGAQIIPLINLKTDEKLVFWETSKKFNISVWTQSNETLNYFELDLLK